MRKIVVLSFISLDGVMQAPGGPDEDTSGGFEYGGWTVPFFDDFAGRVMSKQMAMPFDLLLGRKTYDIFASYWPGRADDPFKSCTKYVVSKGKLDLAWENSMLVSGDVISKLKELKSSEGPMLQVHGSANMIQALLANNLVDELWLKIFPVTLGKGKRLFADGTLPAAFELIESKTSPSGIIFANYKRTGDIKTGSFD